MDTNERHDRLTTRLSPRQLGKRALAAFNRHRTERRLYKDAVRRQRAYYYEKGIPQLSIFAGPLIDEFYRPDPETPSPPPTAAELEDIEAVNRATEALRDNEYKLFTDPLPDLGSRPSSK